MRAEDMEMRRLGQGGEHPSSLEARAGMFLEEARPRVGLAQAEIAAIEKQLLALGHLRWGAHLVPALAALAVIFVAGTVMAVAGGWRPRAPFASFMGSQNEPPAPTHVQARAKGHGGPVVVPIEPQPSPTMPEPHQPLAPRRLARAGTVPSAEVKEPMPTEGPLSVEARSLANALARWRRDGKAEAALALLGVHQRNFPHGALWVESQVARAEILLVLGRSGQALAVLDSLALANLPRARELQTLRGELRAHAGRCQEARSDLGRVVSGQGSDDLGKRANRALLACP
jgi:hypothetical protein